MSSQFSFSHQVRDIVNSINSPHSNCSSHTPHSKHTTPTSLSPAAASINHNNISGANSKSLSTLRILLTESPPTHPSSLTPQKTAELSAVKTSPAPAHAQLLAAPSNTSLTLSPLVSEPSPHAVSPPLQLTLPSSTVDQSPAPCALSTALFEPSSTSFAPEHDVREIVDDDDNEVEKVYSLSVNTSFNTYANASLTQFSPLSTASTYSNLTPLYSEQPFFNIPELLSLAPLELGSTPTSSASASFHHIEIVNEPPTHCAAKKKLHKTVSAPALDADCKYDQHQHQDQHTRPKSYILSALRYRTESDSDYDFDVDIESKATAFSILSDLEHEQHLITMGSSCCNGTSIHASSNSTSADDSDKYKQMDTGVVVPNTQPQPTNAGGDGDAVGDHTPLEGDGDGHGHGGDTDLHHGSLGSPHKHFQIEITAEDDNHDMQLETTRKSRAQSLRDKFFRPKSKQSNSKASSAKKQARKDSNLHASPRFVKNESADFEDENIPPIPKDVETPQSHAKTSPKQRLPPPQLAVSLGGDYTETRTYGDEQKDVVSPMMPGLDKLQSITNAKRPSTSAATVLSSPYQSVRLSITPNGQLAPINIMDTGSDDDDEEDESITDSKEEMERSEINAPVPFLKKHSTINTKFVSPQNSRTSEKNVLSRKRRRGGVSERHTLTFSKPPLAVSELRMPMSPRFSEQPIIVSKPYDILHTMLSRNLLFKDGVGMDAEFARKMVNKVVDLMRAADFDKDELLMQQGAAGDAFYAVEYGKFDIIVQSKDDADEDKVVATAERGDCVGEYALLYNQPRTATLKATEPSRVWGITAQQFALMRQEIMDWNVERFHIRQQFIHSIPLFQKLEQHELLNMTHACHAEIYEINDYIIKPGKEGRDNDNVYIIMEGTVVISYDRHKRVASDVMDAERYLNDQLQMQKFVDDDFSSPIVPAIEHQITEFEALPQGAARASKTGGGGGGSGGSGVRGPGHTNFGFTMNSMDSDADALVHHTSTIQPHQASRPPTTTSRSQNSSSRKDKDHNKAAAAAPLSLHMSTDSVQSTPNHHALAAQQANSDDQEPILKLNSTLSGDVMISLNIDQNKRDTGVSTTSNNSAQRLPLSLEALTSVNSARSVHSVNLVDDTQQRSMAVLRQHQAQNTASSQRLGVALLDMGVCRGDKELGQGDYFARNLFVHQYEDDDDDEEIVFTRAHTPCKVLKIARDDFVLIMNASQQVGQGQYLFNDTAIVSGSTLPHNKTWKHQLPCVLSDFEEQQVLGVGSFGKVSLVKHKETNATYALKAVDKYRVFKTGQEEHIVNEKRVLTMLDSPFCVKLFATFKTESTVYFLTEVVMGGELFTVLRFNEKFDKHATRFYAGCVILALEHLHSMDIIYRDLKPENLLLNARGYLQLTDFGFAKKRNTTCTLCGTPQYLAPEVIHNWVQSFATDWWALGVLLFEMVVGHPPFEDDEHVKMYEKILEYDPEFPGGGDLKPKLRHLISKLLEKNAYQRLGSGPGGARQVKQHFFFRGKLNWNDLYTQKLKPPYVPAISDAFDTSHFDCFSDYEESEEDEDEENIDYKSNHFAWVDKF